MMDEALQGQRFSNMVMRRQLAEPLPLASITYVYAALLLQSSLHSMKLNT